MSHKLESDFEHHGLRCVVIAVDMGHRCGYVGIPKEHPLYGVGYSEQAVCLTQEMAQNTQIGKKGAILAFTCSVRSDGEDLVRRSPDVIFDVHGGLTYSDGSKDYPAKSDGLWWFGFDAAHCDDGRDPELMSEVQREICEKYDGWRHGTVRSKEYMEGECRRLANQLLEFMPTELKQRGGH